MVLHRMKAEGKTVEPVATMLTEEASAMPAPAGGTSDVHEEQKHHLAELESLEIEILRVRAGREAEAQPQVPY